MKAAALRIAPPIIIAMLAIVYISTCLFSSKNLLVLEILLQRYAAGHDSRERGVVHDVAAGISGEVLFHHLFRNPSDASGQAGQSGGTHDSYRSWLIHVSGVFSFQNKNQSKSYI